MATEEQVRESLEAVLAPAVKHSLVSMNLVRKVNVSNGKVNITLASTELIPSMREWLKTKAVEA